MYVIFSFKFCISPKAFTLGPTFYYYYFFPKASSQFISASDAAKPFFYPRQNYISNCFYYLPMDAPVTLDTHYKPTSSPEFQDTFFAHLYFFFFQMGAFLPTLALKFRSKVISDQASVSWITSPALSFHRL